METKYYRKYSVEFKGYIYNERQTKIDWLLLLLINNRTSSVESSLIHTQKSMVSRSKPVLTILIPNYKLESSLFEVSHSQIDRPEQLFISTSTNQHTGPNQ